MSIRYYSNGYGRRDPVPECRDPVDRIDCPCCEGAGEHEYGAGMDADAVTCRLCEGFGYLVTSVPAKRDSNLVGIGNK